jgi:flagellar motor switch protein FliM
VTLAQTKIRTADLMGLRVGDIITTEQDVHEPLQVSVQGLNKLTGRPGAYKGYKAIQVADRLVPPAPTNDEES